MSKKEWPHVDSPAAVGQRLKEARQRAGMSQRQLAFPGCTAVYVCRIERGDRVPSLQVLRELARRLGVSEAFLATGEEQPPEHDPLLEAEVALRLEQLELAEHLYAQALDGPPSARGRALGGLGQIALHAGRVDEAIARLEEARELLRDSLAAYPQIPEALGRAYSIRSDWSRAIGVFRASLDDARRRGDRQSEARFSVLLANAFIDSGSLSAARDLLAATLERADDASDPILQARLYWSQSRLHSAEGDAEAAARYARLALAAIEVTEHVAFAARAHHLLAYIELERDNPAEALDLLERGYALAVRAGGAEAEALFRLEKSRALARLGRADEAVSLALDVAGALAESRPEQAGRAYAAAADALVEQGDRSRAIELYELACELVPPRDHSFLLDLYSKLAELLEAEGRPEEALELLKRAVRLRDRNGGAAAKPGAAT
jgi:tetratricopeptide (TPR) repeat protein